MKNDRRIFKVFGALALVFSIVFIWESFYSLEKRLVAVNPATRAVALTELESSSSAVKAKIAREMLYTLKHPPSRPFTFDFDGDYDRALPYWVGDAFSKVGKPGLPILIKILQEENNAIRYSVLLGLSKMGPEGSDVIPELMKIYINPGTGEAPGEICYEALTALGKVGRGNPKVNAFLLETLKEKNSGAWGVVSRYAVESDTSIVKPMFKVMTAVISERTVDVWDYAGCFRSDEKIFYPHIIEALHNKNARVRRWACVILNNIKSAAIKAIPELSKLLFDNDPLVRDTALSVLFNLGSDAAAATPDIVRVLKHSSDKGERALAAKTLARIGPAAKSAVPALEAALSDQEQYVRCSAAAALLKFGVPPERVISTIVVSLFATDIKDVMEYHAATEAIAEIGPKAAGTIPYHIENLTRDSREYIRLGAMKALAGIGPASKKSIPILIKEAESQNVNLRMEGIKALLSIDDGSADVIRIIEKAMQKPHSIERGVVIHGIGGFSRHAPNAPAVILKILSNRSLFLDSWEIEMLIKAIGEAGPNAQELVPALKRMLGSATDAKTKSIIVTVLQKIGTHEAMEAANRQTEKMRK